MRPPSGKTRWHRGRALVLAAASAFLAAVSASPRPAFAVYDLLEELPVENPLYSDIESLALRFGSDGFFVNRRPWTRGEALAFLNDLRRREAAAEGDPSFSRIEREVSPDAPGARRPAWVLEEEGRRVEVSPYAEALYQENRTLLPILNRDYRLGGQASAPAAPRPLFFGDWDARPSS